MKKTLSIIILAAMLLTSLVIMPASADTTAPTGQIWEAEYELGQLSVETMAEADINAGKFYAQDVTGYNDVAISEKPSNNKQALWKNSGAGSELKFNLDVKCSGTMTAYWQMMYSNDFGQFEVYFDDVKISGDTAIDTYAAKNARKFVEFKYENLAVTAGKHVLKFVVMGKNDASTGTLLGLDYFELVGSDNVRRTGKVGEKSENYGKITTYADGSVRYEAEFLAAVDSAIYAKATPMTDIYSKVRAWMSYGAHLLLKDPYRDSVPEIDLEFNVETAGKYDVTFAAMKAPEFGIAEFYIDGVQIGSAMDQFAPKDGDLKLFDTGYLNSTAPVELAAGKHTLTIKYAGFNENASYYTVDKDGDGKKNEQGCRLSLDYMELTPVIEEEPVVPPTPPTSDGIVIVFVGVTAALVGVISVSALLRKKVNAK